MDWKQMMKKEKELPDAFPGAFPEAFIDLFSIHCCL